MWTGLPGASDQARHWALVRCGENRADFKVLPRDFYVLVINKKGEI